MKNILLALALAACNSPSYIDACSTPDQDLQLGDFVEPCDLVPQDSFVVHLLDEDVSVVSVHPTLITGNTASYAELVVPIKGVYRFHLNNTPSVVIEAEKHSFTGEIDPEQFGTGYYLEEGTYFLYINNTEGTYTIKLWKDNN